MFPITYGCTSVSLGVLNEDVCAALTELARGGGGGGGGGALNKVLYGEAPTRGPNPYPFIYHFR